MAITVSTPNNVESNNGNSLAVFKESTTNKFYVKDINGQIQDIASGLGLTVIFEIGTGANSTQRIGSGTASAVGSTISGGTIQNASGLSLLVFL